MTISDDTLDSITTLCAQVALDGVGRAPASHALLLAASAKVREAVSAAGQDATRHASIHGALAAAKSLQPAHLAPQVRYELTRTAQGITLSRTASTSDDTALTTLQLVTDAAYDLKAVLAVIGFETYELAPIHIVTPVVTPAKVRHHILRPLFELLDHIGQAAGLDEHLSRMAAMGGIQEFLRENHLRNPGSKDAASAHDVLDFLEHVDILSALSTTTVEALSPDVAMFSVPDLPLQVLMHVGTNELNIARSAEKLISALCGHTVGEISGAQLLSARKGDQ